MPRKRGFSKYGSNAGQPMPSYIHRPFMIKLGLGETCLDIFIFLLLNFQLRLTYLKKYTKLRDQTNQYPPSFLPPSLPHSSPLPHYTCRDCSVAITGMVKTQGADIYQTEWKAGSPVTWLKCPLAGEYHLDVNGLHKGIHDLTIGFIPPLFFGTDIFFQFQLFGYHFLYVIGVTVCLCLGKFWRVKLSH